MLAPMVALMRLPLMATETQRGAAWRTETNGAVTEKLAAVAEGVMAAQMSVMQSALSFWPEIFAGRTPSLLNGRRHGALDQAALKPASRRVKANFKRLSESPTDEPDSRTVMPKRQKPRSHRERGFAIQTHGPSRTQYTAKITAPVRET